MLKGTQRARSRCPSPRRGIGPPRCREARRTHRRDRGAGRRVGARCTRTARDVRGRAHVRSRATATHRHPSRARGSGRRIGDRREPRDDRARCCRATVRWPRSRSDCAPRGPGRRFGDGYHRSRRRNRSRPTMDSHENKVPNKVPRRPRVEDTSPGQGPDSVPPYPRGWRCGRSEAGCFVSAGQSRWTGRARRARGSCLELVALRDGVGHRWNRHRISPRARPIPIEITSSITRFIVPPSSYKKSPKGGRGGDIRVGL